MIGLLRGQVLEKQPNRVIVDVHGVGYDVHVPLSTYYQIGDEGSDVTLRIYTHVREEALHLYGFLTDLERQLFERLIGISGIGPKLAVALLSGREYELFLQMAARREELFKALDATWEAMKDVPYEEAERDINDFVAKMRSRTSTKKKTANASA